MSKLRIGEMRYPWLRLNAILILVVLLGTLYIRGYFTCDVFSLGLQSSDRITLYAIDSWRGRVGFRRQIAHPSINLKEGMLGFGEEDLYTYHQKRVGLKWETCAAVMTPDRMNETDYSVPALLGFEYIGHYQQHRYQFDEWTAPVWAILIVPLLLTYIVMRRFIIVAIKRRRLRNMLCIKCGYDLRATPNRCPECGTTVEAATRPPAK